MKKYCLHPGVVMSKNDRDYHHIPASSLAQLYNVPWSECVEFSLNKIHNPDEMICLYPDYHGKYKIKSRSGEAKP